MVIRTESLTLVFVFVAVVEAAGWPTPAADDGVALGQVAGVGVDSHGNVHVFHRGSRVWDQRWVYWPL